MCVIPANVFGLDATGLTHAMIYIFIYRMCIYFWTEVESDVISEQWPGSVWSVQSGSEERLNETEPSPNRR